MSTFRGIRERATLKAHNVKLAFSSPAAFKNALQTHDTVLDEHGHPGNTVTWSNEDLDPTPPEKRTWRWWNFVTFYLGLAMGNWTLGSTMVGIGLNWWQSMIVIFLSQLISSTAMFFNSRCASVYHIGYPVVARSVYGMWGSYYFVGARAALAIIWYGVQCKSCIQIQEHRSSNKPQCSLEHPSCRMCSVAFLVTNSPIFQTTSLHLLESPPPACWPSSFSGSCISPSALSALTNSPVSSGSSPSLCFQPSLAFLSSAWLTPRAILEEALILN